MTHAEQYRASLLTKSAWTAGGVANTVTDYLPFVGAAKDLGRGVSSLAQGKWGQGLGQLGMGLGFGALDLATGGLGGTIARGVGKLGIRGALAAGTHAAGAAGAKGIAQGAGRVFAKAAPVSVGLGVGGTALGSALEAPAAQPPQYNAMGGVGNQPPWLGQPAPIQQSNLPWFQAMEQSYDPQQQNPAPWAPAGWKSYGLQGFQNPNQAL